MLETPSAFQCTMLRVLLTCDFFWLPVAFLPRPLALRDDGRPSSRWGGPLRGLGPGTAPAWWVLTGRAPLLLIKWSSSVILRCCAVLWFSRVRLAAQYLRLQHSSSRSWDLPWEHREEMLPDPTRSLDLMRSISA